MSDPNITPIRESDYEEWSRLFRAYIDFYKTPIPDEQYPKTFARILDPNKDLYGLVLRNPDDPTKLIGIAHFFPHQTPWREEMIMLFNGVDLYIDPNVRAKGYGRKMIEAVAEKAKEMGCFRLQWLTQHGNVTARKLYDTMATSDFVAYRMALE